MMSTVVNNQKLINLFKKNHVIFVALFGSRAKGTTHAGSDFDFLIETDPDKNYSLFDQIELQDKLKTELKSEVDLVTVGGLNKHLKANVDKTMKVLYDERKR